MAKKGGSCWEEIRDGLSKNGWPVEASEPGSALRVACPPSELDHPPRREAYAVEVHVVDPVRVELRSVWRGQGPTSRSAELAAFVAAVAPRVAGTAGGELRFEPAHLEVSFHSATRWSAKGGYDELEEAMCENMTRLGRLVDRCAGVLRGDTARAALDAFADDEATRL